jgi:hypothetical protein
MKKSAETWIVGEYVWTAMLARSDTPASATLISFTVLEELSKDGFHSTLYGVKKALEWLGMKGWIERKGDKGEWQVAELGMAVFMAMQREDKQFDKELVAAYRRFWKRFNKQFINRVNKRVTDNLRQG